MSRMIMTMFRPAAIVLTIAAAAASAADQPGCDPFAFYDVVMPMTIAASDQRGADEVVVIRYIPGDTSLAREYQVTIVVAVNGTITARRVDPTGVSLREQLRHAEEQRPDAACDDVLKELKTATRRFDRQPVLRRLLTSFSRMQVPAQLPASLYLDAPRYEVVHWAKMNQSSFVIYSGLDTAKHPLIRWVKEVAAALN